MHNFHETGVLRKSMVSAYFGQRNCSFDSDKQVEKLGGRIGLAGFREVFHDK